MEFSATFLHHTLLASITALFWFGLPGLVVMRLLGLVRHTLSLHNWLIAPALGLSTFGSFSLLVASLVGFNFIALVVSWLVFLIGIHLWQTRITQVSPPPSWSLSSLTSFNLLVVAALWAVMPTLNIYPFVHQDALFVGVEIFDHAKVAVVDAIAREGVLPLNPYYAPEGERILLLYYYLWHFLAAQLKLLLGVSGWQAEVAMNGFTAFASLSFLIALAGLCNQKRAAIAAWLVILLAFLGPPADILMIVLSKGVHYFIGYPQVDGKTVHALEQLWLQAAWVPQHVLSALNIVVLLFLISRLLLSIHLQLSYAVVIGLTAATGFGASTWVGGIAMVIALPALGIAGLSLLLPKQHYFSAIKTAIIAVIIAAIVSIPSLISQTSGPSAVESQLPFGFGLYPSTNLFTKEPYFGYIMHIILFWLQFLPLVLGVGYVIGMMTLFLRKADTPEVRHFHYLSLGAVMGFFLIVLFLQSIFWNNTFGWRTVLVPVMLLLVWGAVGLADFLDRDMINKSSWWLHKLLHRWQLGLLSLMMMGIMLGLISTARIYHLPDPVSYPASNEEMQVRQSFFKQYEIWKKVREFVKPDELVQVNPDGYLTLTTWPATLPYALFADRSIAYANIEYSTVFAYRYDAEQNRETYHLMQNIFSADPQVESLQKLRDVFKVKAMLVDKFDPVWSTDKIEQSGIYKIVYADADFRIYLSQ
ncbi:hypothetical protein [Candidatus Albibeggiatoa sp. nov. NOAA]|uniref:hypothetical protein n=1 Tax=Candidatus Albibeggiatoa sp. nov. NOAA TaxID=3162724 RepID=UPI0032F8169A|nr:hypothetical protein [Thiotrichaceae bacterium]